MSNMSQKGFNRDIVECKVDLTGASGDHTYSFNRDIVECKARPDYALLLKDACVLIET